MTRCARGGWWGLASRRTDRCAQPGDLSAVHPASRAQEPGAPTREPGARTGRSRRGFTLIEVLGAIVIVSVGLMSSFYLVGMGTAVNTDAKDVAQAYQAAQQEIEILRNIPFTTLQPIVISAPASGTPEARFLQQNGQWDASRPGDALNGQTYPGFVPALGKLPNGRGGLIVSGTGYKNVTVIVRWTDPGNHERSVALGTIIAKGGIDPR